MCSDILPGILSGIHSAILSVKCSGILSDILSNILSDTVSGILFGMCSGAGVACGTGDMVFRSRRGPQHPETATWLGGEGGRGRRRRTRRRRRGRRRSHTFVKIKTFLGGACRLRIIGDWCASLNLIMSGMLGQAHMVGLGTIHHKAGVSLMVCPPMCAHMPPPLTTC